VPMNNAYIDSRDDLPDPDSDRLEGSEHNRSEQGLMLSNATRKQLEAQLKRVKEREPHYTFSKHWTQGGTIRS